MIRQFRALEQGRFDVLVIGGGVYGAWTAYDAALRGLSVALIEKTDWGAGTSSASSKLIHGGLRYLEHFWFGLVRKSVVERALLAKLAPHRVRPMRFNLPVYRDSRAGMLKMKAGLALYDAIAGRARASDRHSSYTRAELMTRCPFLSSYGLQGGFGYSDCATDDARFVTEIVSGAAKAGAVAVNHARAAKLCRSGSGVVAGAIVQDELGAHATEVLASVTILATGPWGLLPGVETAPPRVRLTKGVHLVMPRLPTDESVFLTAKRDGRVFFLIPWYEATLLGTTDTDYRDDPDDVSVAEDDVMYLLDEANIRLSGIRWTRDDILGSFAGLRTLRDNPGRLPSAVTREWSLEEPAPGLLLPVGGKFTSARAEAATIVSRSSAILGRKTSSATGRLPFPWTPEGCAGKDGGEVFQSWREYAVTRGKALGMDEDTARTASYRYGASIKDLHAIIERDAGRRRLADRIVPSIPFCRAEAVHATRNEMAVTLEDVTRRRIPLSILSRLDSAIENELGELMAGLT